MFLASDWKLCYIYIGSVRQIGWSTKTLTIPLLLYIVISVIVDILFTLWAADYVIYHVCVCKYMLLFLSMLVHCIQ